MFMGTGIGDYIITITTVATENPALIVKRLAGDVDSRCGRVSEESLCFEAFEFEI